ncbi:hypothetical protein EVJ50_03415 [Synechococcus sp. RSCCF101]|uniref:hypothetical protein n=1 Tax=Synechococcus sp. RSCCF101 TaxID=2511069 RepID=UPI00124630CE|nr:hypothetical protein [Synechococcus sp. RSCCF101]QEY31441.1 hypothetical protein EVJ50_03415 [Synechococcus sp. RSCCF101]
MSDVPEAWQALAASRWLPLLLLGLGTCSSAVHAHAPLVAFAAMSGVMLKPRRAVVVALLIWLVNQAIGFGIRGYPLSGMAFTWGSLMGVGTLLVVSLASIRPPFSRSSMTGHALWCVIALVGGFVLYQGLISLAYPVILDGHFMGLDVVASVFRKQAVWAGGMALGHGLLMRLQMARRLA